MSADRLKTLAEPNLAGARMLLGFSGWMNGGDVSIGTVRYLAASLEARRLAEIEPRGFYIYNFPGSMEISTLFRPQAVIEEGLVRRCDLPENVFDFDEASRLVLFRGKEPNLNWEDFADCLFALAGKVGVDTVYFIGSYAGLVPHTRDPRLYASVSDAAMRGELQAHGVRFSNYEGPAGFSTFLTQAAGRRGVRMATLVAEVPAYVQGPNPRCIEAVTRRLAAILGLDIDLDDLRALTDVFEAKVSQAVQQREELAEKVHKLEAEYDSELFDTQMGDLRDWLEQQGIRLD